MGSQPGANGVVTHTPPCSKMRHVPGRQAGTRKGVLLAGNYGEGCLLGG